MKQFFCGDQMLGKRVNCFLVYLEQLHLALSSITRWIPVHLDGPTLVTAIPSLSSTLGSVLRHRCFAVRSPAVCVHSAGKQIVQSVKMFLMCRPESNFERLKSDSPKLWVEARSVQIGVVLDRSPGHTLLVVSGNRRAFVGRYRDAVAQAIEAIKHMLPGIDPLG